eukprot:1917143-Prymnesium_polylepis.1
MIVWAAAAAHAALDMDWSEALSVASAAAAMFARAKGRSLGLCARRDPNGCAPPPISLPVARRRPPRRRERRLLRAR